MVDNTSAVYCAYSNDPETTNEFEELAALLGEEFAMALPMNESKDVHQSRISFPISTEGLTSKTKLQLGKVDVVSDVARVSPTPSMSSSKSSPSPTTGSSTVVATTPKSSISNKKGPHNTSKPKANPRKRKSAEGKQGTSSSSTASSQLVDSASSRQKQTLPLTRRERNREHAKRSRVKKKEFTKQLEETANILKAENEKLREFLYRNLDTNKAETDKLINDKVMIPTNRFILALKEPSNRVLSDGTADYISSLREKMSYGT